MSLRSVRDTCAVCDNVRPCEQHHVIPQRAGGEDTPTLPLCRSCHDMVDRTPLRDWSPVEALSGITGAWDRLDAPGRLMLLKLFAITCDARATRQRDDATQ